MTADDGFFVPAGGKLSDAIKQEGGASAEPQVLFTENWDIEYKGLTEEATHDLRLKSSTSRRYKLTLHDGDGKAVEVEFVTAKGKTVALVTLTPLDIRPMANDEILHVRGVASL